MGADYTSSMASSVPSHPRSRKRSRTAVLVPALLLCSGAAVMCGDMMGITSNTGAATTTDYRRLGDRAPTEDTMQPQTSMIESTSSTPASLTMPMPSFSDAIINNDGTITTYDLWLPDDNGGGPFPLHIMQTKPNNWLFGNDHICCATIQAHLDAGIAVASLSCSGAMTMEDHQSMAMDFMKSKAEEHGIDPERIALHQDYTLMKTRQRKLGQDHEAKNYENIVARTSMHWAAIPPTYADIPYRGRGSGGERTLDFWQAKPVDENDTGHRPIVLYIHEGGWLSGDKSMLDGKTFVSAFLEKGISFASINYRKTTDTTIALPVPVLDAARAVQFLKSRSQKWDLDVSRFGLAGFSAGACTCMWLAFTQDLANPDSDDPVERESTRVAAVAVLSGQATIDPKEMMQWIGPAAATHPMVFDAVGEPNYESMMNNYEQHVSMFRQFSPIHHIDRGEWGELGPPPLWMAYGNMSPLPSTDPMLAIHHPKFGILLKEHCDRVDNAECHLWIPGLAGYGSPPEEYPSGADFLYKKLLGVGTSNTHNIHVNDE